MRKASRKSRAQPVSGVVRKAVLDSGETLYRVSKDSGVTYSALHSFITGKQMLSLKGFDKLCAYLGMVLKWEREER